MFKFFKIATCECVFSLPHHIYLSIDLQCRKLERIKKNAWGRLIGLYKACIDFAIITLSSAKAHCAWDPCEEGGAKALAHSTCVATQFVLQCVCVSAPVCTGTSLVSFVSLFLSILFQERRDNVCSQVSSGFLLDSHREHSALHSVLSSAHLCTCRTFSVHTPPLPLLLPTPAMPSASLNISPCRTKKKEPECAFAIPTCSIRLEPLLPSPAPRPDWRCDFELLCRSSSRATSTTTVCWISRSSPSTCRPTRRGCGSCSTAWIATMTVRPWNGTPVYGVSSAAWMGSEQLRVFVLVLVQVGLMWGRSSTCCTSSEWRSPQSRPPGSCRGAACVSVCVLLLRKVSLNSIKNKCNIN